jgi:putative FmdB family regulatory protein
MPTYEYVCTSCGHRLEAVQSFSDPSLTTCPDCQGSLRKVFGNVGIVLKGSGFYKNDSRSAAARSNGSAPKESKDTKDTKDKESTSAKEKDSTTSGGSGTKESGSAKEASAPTPSPSASGSSGSGGSEKAAASKT